MNEAVRQYMREIGAKGGKANKGARLRKKINRRAALIRHGKIHIFPWPDNSEWNQESYRNLSLQLRKRIASKLIRLSMNQTDFRPPEDCSSCGQVKGFNRINGHHDDYDRPMEVRFVCGACHKKIHSRYADSNSDAKLSKNVSKGKNKV